MAASRSSENHATVARAVNTLVVAANTASTIVFAEAIRFVLARGPLATPAIHDEVRALLPDLCDDREELIINGEPYGSSAWKRRVRHAQLHLRRQGVIRRDPASRRWSLAAAG